MADQETPAEPQPEPAAEGEQAAAEEQAEQPAAEPAAEGEQQAEATAEEQQAEQPAEGEQNDEQPAGEGQAEAPAEGEQQAEPPAEAAQEEQAAPADEAPAAEGETAEAQAETEQPAAEEQAAEAPAAEEQAEAKKPAEPEQQAEGEQSAAEPEQAAEQEQPAAEPEQAAEEQPASQSPKPEVEQAGTGMDPAGDQAHEVDPHAPSPDQTVDREATATVKFVLMPSGQVATLRCHLGQNFLDLRDHFAAELKMPAEIILFMFNGKTIDNKNTLVDLGVGPNGTVQLEIQSSDPVNQPIRPFKPRQEYHMPDVITVRVPNDDGTYRDVVVEIERTTRKKPFLGGYRHKKTSVEFHHAAAQTVQKQKAVSTVEKFCRDTQTVQQKHNTQQTTNDMATQMTAIGVYVSNMEDKLMVPGKYTTADEHHKMILERIVIIQKYYRRWLAKKYVEQVRDDKLQRSEWERQEEIRKKQEKENRIKREFERRMNPKTKEDFDLLYHALEKWRQEEQNKINQTLRGAERKAALCQLLEQETQLIASIGRHKLEADGENRTKGVLSLLDKAASPKKWKGPDGKTTEMDTPYTIRAQQLRDIYNSINMKYLTQDERLDVLLTLKHTVNEHDCKLTQEIIELIDREADLLMRGVKESNLEGLRKRIATLFLQYIKTPTFNPEAARLLKVPQDPSTMRKDIYFCSGCNQYLASTEFHMSSNTRHIGRCRKCQKTDNDARERQDHSHYRFMLENLRTNEEMYGDGSKIAFLLQENDLRHLVENVWNSQSALSVWSDLYDLVLVRWDKHAEWSPWNCVLLTKEEASAHEKLENLDEAYGKTFIHKVKHKHTLARNYFSRLPGMAEHIRRTQAQSASTVSRGPTAISGKAVPVQPLKG